MKSHRKAKQLVLIMLVILMLPVRALPQSVMAGSFISLRQAYETAQSMFSLEDTASYSRARSAFVEAGNYADSGKYIHYIDAAMALEAEDYESAAIVFGALGGVDFLDAARQYEYAQGRRAEDAGEVKAAMILYARAGIPDALARLAVLSGAHPEIDMAKDDLPSGARDGGYAYVMEDNLAAANEPGGAEVLAEFSLFEPVQTRTFAHDAEGRAWAIVDVLDEDLEVVATGHLPVSALHIMTEAEEANYRKMLESIPPLTDHYGRVTTNSVNVRPQASKSGSNGTVNRDDIVELLEEAVPGDDGEPWQRIVTAEGIEGYLPARFVERLAVRQEREHRERIGRAPAPTPRMTPMPTPAPTPVPTEMPIPRAISGDADRPTIPPMPAPVTEADTYDRALFLLLDRRVESLKEAITLCSELGDYPNAVAYIPFGMLLLMLEQEEFDTARAYLDEIEAEGYFDYILEIESELEIRIPDANGFFQYINAREAEANGRTYQSLGLYDTLDALDSASRMVKQGLKLPAPTVEDALNGVTPADSAEKLKRRSTRKIVPEADDLISLIALNNAMKGGDYVKAATLLNNGEYTDILSSSLRGMQYLFDGSILHREVEGTGLVLRADRYAFYGEFAGGRPHGRCVAIQTDSTEFFVIVAGTWSDGKLSGEGEISWYYSDGAHIRTIIGTFGGPDEVASGKLIEINGSSRQFTITTEDGYAVLDDRWTMKSYRYYKGLGLDSDSGRDWFKRETELNFAFYANPCRWDR